MASPKTMRALLHNQSKQLLTLSCSHPVPKPNKNEYLLKVDATALTTGELLWPRPAELNESHPGIEMAGEVVSTPTEPSSPSKLSKFKPGDKVYMRTAYPRAGSAREYSIGLERELAIRPSNISAEEAASVPVGALTAWQGLFVHAGLTQPKNIISYRDENTTVVNGTSKAVPRVLINGASGGCGIWAVQLAHAAGCYVVGTTSSKNASLVTSLGADEIIDYTKTSLLEWAKDRKEDSKVDLVLDTVGGDSLEQSWHTVRENGLVLTIVPSPDMVWKWDLDRPEGISQSVQGKFFIMDTNGEDLSLITKLIEMGVVKPVVDSVWKLEDYKKAFERLDSRRAVGKVVLTLAE